MRTAEWYTEHNGQNWGIAPFLTGSEGSKFLNHRDICGVCHKEKDEFELIKHHISYFPERIMYVHFNCHVWIHDSLQNKTGLFLQYTDEEVKAWYRQKELLSNKINGDNNNES